MKTLELIIITTCVVFAAITCFDFVVYVIKKAPKSATLSFANWKVGFVCLGVVVYYILNNQHLFSHE